MRVCDVLPANCADFVCKIVDTQLVCDLSALKWGPNPVHVIFFFFQHTVRAPVFGRHQFFGTSEHYGKANGSLLSGWINNNYVACCWFPTSSNIWILPSQFWQIRFDSYWLHCSKCRILVLLWYPYARVGNLQPFARIHKSWIVLDCDVVLGLIVECWCTVLDWRWLHMHTHTHTHHHHNKHSSHNNLKRHKILNV